MTRREAKRIARAQKHRMGEPRQAATVTFDRRPTRGPVCPDDAVALVHSMNTTAVRGHDLHTLGARQATVEAYRVRWGIGI